jgi:hypothetical protein
MTLYILAPAKTTVIEHGGESVLIADNTMGISGGLIINPLLPEDQGIFPVESLFVNTIGPAGLSAGTPTGTIRLLPGQSYLTPPLTNVWVNANSSGHNFTAFFSSAYEAPVSQPVPGIPGGEEFGIPIYPPSGPTGLLETIGGYLYQEYTDDDDLQGFVEAQTDMQQDYVDTFNALNLPIYPGPVVQGKLLDWVAKGLYGMSRPALSSGIRWGQGPLNTYGCNYLVPLNEIKNYTQFDTVTTDDDTYRRILTWHFYKGDGKYFDVRWLKRRIWRFLFGQDGTSPETAVWQGRNYSIADTEQISISMGADRNVMIEFILGKRTITGGAMCNEFGCNGFGPPSFPTVNKNFVPIPLNDVESSIVQYFPLPFMTVFQEAVGSGALELPYQFKYKVGIVTVR